MKTANKSVKKSLRFKNIKKLKVIIKIVIKKIKKII